LNRMKGELMKINILSDLHLECAPFMPPPVVEGVVVLAGDIGDGVTGIEWAKEAFDVPVLYVPGNHEFHDDLFTMGQHRKRMCEAAAGTNIILLDNNVAYFDSVRFIGSTLWTDLSKLGSVLYCDADSILIDQPQSEDPEYFNATDAQALFNSNKAWLQDELAKPYDGKTVVVTHHAPSQKSIHNRYQGNAWNDCFVSDVEGLMHSIDVWIHGHTHSSHDYKLNNTRVVCNPRGYPTFMGGWENQEFNPSMVISI